VETELIKLELFAPADLFTQEGIAKVYNHIEAQVKGLVFDVSTKKGREEIASTAHKVAKSKTAIDKIGKESVAGKKAEVKAVDMNRSILWDKLEALQKEVRQPLTDFENAEKLRIEEREDRIISVFAFSSASSLALAAFSASSLAFCCFPKYSSNRSCWIGLFRF